MKNKISKDKFGSTLFFIGVLIMMLAGMSSQAVWADEGVAADPVAGCQAIAVDPEASLEMQQSVCNAAEQNASSSCAAAGHGMCSSPKKYSTMMDGKTCLCISEVAAETPVE